MRYTLFRMPSGAEPPVPADTTADAHELQIAAYRRMGGCGRTEAMFRLNALARELVRAGIRRRHPEYDEEQVRTAIVALVHGADVARAVFGGREPASP